MLKFLRKYQLIILAIGGSLLMVVFLLQPVITSFNKSRMNRTVARYADGEKVGALDIEYASAELNLVRRVAPVVFLDPPQGLGLPAEDQSGDARELQWLMLSRLAEEAGVVGGVEDGRALVEQQIMLEAQVFRQTYLPYVLQGMMSPQDFSEQAEQQLSLLRTQLYREVQNAAGSMRGATEDDLWRRLAKFQGAYRLVNMYYSVPAFSPAGARALSKQRNDAVAVDAAVLPGSILAGTVPEPTEAELRDFFEPRAGTLPADDEYGVGYAQSARIRLGWLKLDRAAFEAAVPVDRVELNKLYQQDSQKPESDRRYPGDFASERARIEADYRADRAAQLMVTADQIIRAAVLRVTRTLEKKNGVAELPQDWINTRPSLQSLADAVVSGLAEQGVTLPTPTIEQRDTEWFNASRLQSTPDVGQAVYRLGSRFIPVARLPEEINEYGVVPALGMQVGIPQVEPSAEDSIGNRYYLLITEARPAGPSDSIDDAGRDRVIADYKSVQGYRRLAEMADELRAAAESGGVVAAVDIAVPSELPAGVNRPGVSPNLRVAAERIDAGPLARGVDPRLNAKPFRDAVLAAASGIDPLTPPSALSDSPLAVAVPLPQSRSLAVARIVAPRPVTEEQFRSRAGMTLAQMSVELMMQATEKSPQPSPFSYESLFERYGLRSVGQNTDEPAGG
ncbi:MAG: hypothetical protein D6692_14095 [Planctomycetota bacterium]|nr:MAG: hypothetical protein D6692_14095 [Planctomycetota bacterium]